MQESGSGDSNEDGDEEEDEEEELPVHVPRTTTGVALMGAPKVEQPAITMQSGSHTTKGKAALP